MIRAKIHKPPGLCQKKMVKTRYKVEGIRYKVRGLGRGLGG
jgi:hypothetical protein